MVSKQTLGKKTLDEANAVMAKAAQRIEDTTLGLLADPDDPEALHQYRISLRVARSLLTFVKPCCKEKRVRDIQRKLKWLQTPTSRVRELDMLADALEEGTREHMICSQVRNEERAAFIKLFKRKKTRRVLEDAIAQLKDMPWRPSVKKKGLNPRALELNMLKMQTICKVKMEAVVFEDHESVHSVRKQTKALRYVAREFSRLLPDDAGKVSADAKAVQDKLGELCDCRNNARLVDELCGEESLGTVLSFDRQAAAIVAALNAQR